MVATVAEFHCRRRTVGWRGDAVRIAVKRDGGDRNRRLRRQTPFQLGVARIAIGEAIAMAITVNHDVDIVRIIEGRGGPLEGRIVEMPVRRPLPPKYTRDLAPVGGKARPSAFDLEIILIPIGDLAHRLCGDHRVGDVLDQIAVHGH